MNEGPRALMAAGLLMMFVGFMLIRKTKAKPLRLLFITLMTFRFAVWIFSLGLLAMVLGVFAMRQP